MNELIRKRQQKKLFTSNKVTMPYVIQSGKLKTTTNAINIDFSQLKGQ
jgi:hypothetical protein